MKRSFINWNMRWNSHLDNRINCSLMKSEVTPFLPDYHETSTLKHPHDPPKG